MMTLEEAITHCQEKSCGNSECALEHKQLAEWLRELQNHRNIWKDQSQKAKAYDEAKLRMSAAYNSNRCTIGFMNEIFPELKESEDEKIRKDVIHHIKFGKEHNIIPSKRAETWIAWLEKQGEQKPAWSEEDEIMFRKAIITIDNVRMDTDSQEYYQGICDWLTSLYQKLNKLR